MESPRARSPALCAAPISSPSRHASRTRREPRPTRASRWWRASPSLTSRRCAGRCLSRTYLPQEADVKRIEWMGRVLANVASSFVHNLLRPAQEPAYLERAVVSDEPISEAGRDKFLAVAGERGQELLTELDTFLTRLAGSERSET